MEKWVVGYRVSLVVLCRCYYYYYYYYARRLSERAVFGAPRPAMSGPENKQFVCSAHLTAHFRAVPLTEIASNPPDDNVPHRLLFARPRSLR